MLIDRIHVFIIRIRLMVHEPNWDHYRSFLAVMQASSLSGAARQLHTTQPTISRHIDALELVLGVPLFVRSRHGLAPTEAAISLVSYAKEISNLSAALVRTAAEGEADMSGTVRVAASKVIGVEVLPPFIASFAEKYPRAIVELVVSNQTENLLRREADIAVRMVRPVQKALLAQKIGDVPIGLYAHQNYIEQYGRPETIEELAAHTCIGPQSEVPAPDFLAAENWAHIRKAIRLKSDCDLAQFALLRSGYGIGAIQHCLAVQNDRLLPILSDEVGFPMEMWLVMHEDLKTNSVVRSLHSHLREALKGYVASTK